jgi:hypothetical protein
LSDAHWFSDDNDEMPKQLTIIIIPDGDLWYAQSKEWNYSCLGEDTIKLRANFRRGLELTVAHQLKTFGQVTFEPTGPREWQDLCLIKGARTLTLNLDFLKEM